MPSNHLILCHLLLLLSVFPNIRVFSSESVLCLRWPKYWSFSFSISPSNEYSRPISFRMDWLDLPVIQGTLKSFLQHHSSEASILWHSAFFIVQLSYPFMSTGKTIALTKLINLITWTSALSNSMKLWAMLWRATQDGRVMVESSNKMWSTGEGNVKPHQYSCLENLMNSMKRQCHTKKYDTERWSPQVSRCPIWYWRRVEK